MPGWAKSPAGEKSVHLLGAVLAVLSAATFALFAFAPAARADDADTLTIGGIVYRLDGIDAPELDQNCLDEIGEVYPCGQLAVEALKRFIAGRPIHATISAPTPSIPSGASASVASPASTCIAGL